MSILTCRKMRLAVVTSAVAFLLGILLQVPTLTPGFLPELIPIIASYLGFVSMLFSFVLIVGVALLLLFPRISVGLKLCQH